MEDVDKDIVLVQQQIDAASAKIKYYASKFSKKDVDVLMGEMEKLVEEFHNMKIATTAEDELIQSENMKHILGEDATSSNERLDMLYTTLAFRHRTLAFVSKFNRWHTAIIALTRGELTMGSGND
jgi:hypothetical protein